MTDSLWQMSSDLLAPCREQRLQGGLLTRRALKPEAYVVLHLKRCAAQHCFTERACFPHSQFVSEPV